MTTIEDQVDPEFPVMDSGSKSLLLSSDANGLDYTDDESNSPIFKNKKRLLTFSDSDSDAPEDIIKSVLSDVPESEQKSDNETDDNLIKISVKNSRIRRRAVSEDDSDSDKETTTTQSDAKVSSEDKVSRFVIKNGRKNTRLHKISSGDDSNSQDSVETHQIVNKNEEHQLRMKNKKNKLRDKFKSLLSSREKDSEIKNNDREEQSGNESNEESEDSDDNVSSSIDKIKQKTKERSVPLKMTICDPDTSDEEVQRSKVSKPTKEQKQTKLISPKKQRMSAKEAMENMQKIKSESNRMLREREVSLPYHRPKALTLQDIMKRRKPAVSLDGKVLPVKMNEEQLKHFAHLLEQRQKEMMELCKSESEEEEVIEDDIADVPIENKSENMTNTDSQEPIACIPDKNEFTDNTLAQIKPDVPSAINEDLGDVSSEIHMTSHVDLSGNALNAPEAPVNNESAPEENLQDKSEDISAEMQLVYNDSVEENIAPNNISKESTEDSKINNEENQELKELNVHDIAKDIDIKEDVQKEKNYNLPKKTSYTELDSQLISLQYDSEKTEHTEKSSVEGQSRPEDINSKEDVDNQTNTVEEPEDDDFLNDDLNLNDIDMENIDSIIENAEIIRNTETASATNSPGLINNIPVLSVKPKLTGAPGMIIDLDGSDPIALKKLSGVELLKERFTFFSKLKTPEEMERDREKRIKPGTLHLKLKQELEDKIAEQRSLEWSKRLESEKQQKMEMDAISGDTSDLEDDLEKIEAKLEENAIGKESSSESEEELLEDDVLIEDKPKKKNALLDDEAEESDVEETEDKDREDENKETNGGVDGVDEDEEDSSQDAESSESEDENEAKPKKGRILKAFEDSDDEDITKVEDEYTTPTNNIEENTDATADTQSQNYGIMDSQDDVIQLAQVPKQLSSDVFTSQGSALISTQNITKEDDDLGTQTFSILDANKTVKDINDPDTLVSIADESERTPLYSDDLDKLTVISESQPYNDDLEAVVGMCSGSFQTQNCIEFQPPTTQSQMSQSQAIGEDILDMCTGKFYDNQFVSQNEDKLNTSDDLTPSAPLDEVNEDGKQKSQDNARTEAKVEQKQDGDILKSVLDELNDPEFGTEKPLKFFFDGKSQNKENEPNATNTQVKKRFVIDSDDETNDNADGEQKKKKKFKKKKHEQRALQISDDEDDSEEEIEEDDYFLGNENDNENEEERLVEYDSEENEVVVKPQIVKKKKRKANEFFEQEAELTSEDEWAGSGDEDEAGLDRMEREAGDDDTFHEGQLQRELGLIHMRDVLDQDKREVRLIQELLFEDGDLGAGGRQRKFRWRNADGEEVSGTLPEEFADTQEEEFESEEQWRKQRHEREMFLRQMKNDEKEDDLNVSVNRTTIIKANLTSRTMSSLLEEVNHTKTEVQDATVVVEKKTTKDIPSPAKKPFSIFQQNYHGSLLTRGQGALARLAALATPLAADDDAPRLLQPSSKRNFVFTALTQDDEPKVTKRKAESNVGTPRLVKKMKTEEKQNRSKSSLLEFLKT